MTATWMDDRLSKYPGHPHLNQTKSKQWAGEGYLQRFKAVQQNFIAAVNVNYFESLPHQLSLLEMVLSWFFRYKFHLLCRHLNNILAASNHIWPTAGVRDWPWAKHRWRWPGVVTRSLWDNRLPVPVPSHSTAAKLKDFVSSLFQCLFTSCCTTFHVSVTPSNPTLAKPCNPTRRLFSKYFKTYLIEYFD